MLSGGGLPHFDTPAVAPAHRGHPAVLPARGDELTGAVRPEVPGQSEEVLQHFVPGRGLAPERQPVRAHGELAFEGLDEAVSETGAVAVEDEPATRISARRYDRGRHSLARYHVAAYVGS